MPADIEAIAKYSIRPDHFSEAMLLRRLWAKQNEIALSVANNPLTAVKGCHASGKTFMAAGLPLWWLVRHKQSVSTVIAPTLRQVKTFWGEIALARQDAAPQIRQFLPEPTTTRLEVDYDRYAMGASSSRGVNVQGLHGKNVLAILDEAPGIAPEIWDAIHGIRAGGNVRLLALGNPVVPIGDFYDAFGRQRSMWKRFSISAFDTPNLQTEDGSRALTIEELLELDEDRLAYVPFPSLVTRRWVKERYLAWGPNHPKYQSRVLAEFPQQSPYAVFELAWIERAKRDATEDELRKAQRMTIQVGIDVAGPGDDETALCARVGGIVLEQIAWHQADPFPEVMKVLWRLQQHPRYKLGAIVVDINGIGYHFAKRIAEREPFASLVFGYNAGASPLDTTRFANAKSEDYFTCREWMRVNEISGLNDEECEAQLSTMLYRETDRGLTEIRSKQYMREQGVPSPDRAEALILAFKRIIPQHVEVRLPGYQLGG